MSELIVCGVDGSEATASVLDTAQWLTDALGARLVVVRAAPGELQRQADEELRSQLGATGAEARVVNPPAADAIIEAANEPGAALVVVGSRGRGGLRAALLGSVSHEVAAGSRIPVVVVPTGDEKAAGISAGADGSVVVGVDGSTEALGAAAVAGQLARRLGLRLVIVHARQDVRAALAYRGARSSTPPVTGQEDSVVELVDRLITRAHEAAGTEATDTVEPGPPAEVLEQVAEREGARLIVIATRGAGGVRASMLGSVARELAAHAGCPVVVLSHAAAAAATAG